MAGERVLSVLQLTESFGELWGDWAAELGVEVTQLSHGQAPAANSTVSLISAGGEEHRALDALSELRALTSHHIIVVGADPSNRLAVAALHAGATDYFALPMDVDVLRRCLERLLDTATAHADLSETDGAFRALLGESRAVRSVVEAARRVGQHDVTVLIRGDTGTGKELLARGLHDAGRRAAGAFVPVNCAAIPRELMESELFGHERGAFTDAHASKPGLFEEAHGGTLFLDEIGHLPLPLQGKLLRALEDKRVRRLGSVTFSTVDVRVIAATNVDLERSVRNGEFREDLFYRLNVVSLVLPPLRERGEDVILLARAFAKQLAERYELPSPTIGPAALTAIRAHAWPGNVRELRHAVERALLMSEPGTLSADHLVPQAMPAPASNVLPFPASLDEINTVAAAAMVAHFDGNKSAAARALGVSRTRLQRLLDRGGDA